MVADYAKEDKYLCVCVTVNSLIGGRKIDARVKDFVLEAVQKYRSNQQRSNLWNHRFHATEPRDLQTGIFEL